MPLLPDHRVPGEAEDANGLAEDEGVDVESLDVAADHCRGPKFFQLIMLNLFFLSASTTISAHFEEWDTARAYCDY